MHKTEIFVAEEFKLKDFVEENDTSMKGVELGNEAGQENEVIKAVLILTEEKDVLVHETEISVASISV